MESSIAAPGTFVNSNGFDPLRHLPSDFFWFAVEPSFRPFQEDDISTLAKLPPTAHRDVPIPYSQRLIAALLDEGGKGAATASRALRTIPSPEPLWLPAALPALCSFNRIFESRVRLELEDLGVLRPDDVDPISERIRLDAWHLRNLSAASADSVRTVATHVASEVKTQSARRELKRKHDQIEVEYIKKMMVTGGKRGKSRFSKLLREMHPYHDLKVGTVLPGSHANGDFGTGGGTASKKKKKRSSNHDRKSSSKYDVSKH